MFCYTFKPLNIEFIFSPAKYLNTIILYFIFSLAMFFLFVVFLVKQERILGILLGIYSIFVFLIVYALLYRIDGMLALYSSVLVLICVIYTYTKVITGYKNYIKPPVSSIISHNQNTLSLFVALILTLSFFFAGRITTTNLRVINLIDKNLEIIIDQSFNIAMSGNKPQSVIPDIQNIVGANFDYTSFLNINSIDTAILDEATQETKTQLKQSIENQILELINQYNVQINIFASFLIFLTIHFIFNLANIFIVPINILLFKMLSNFGVFKVYKETVEIERLDF